MAVFFAQPQQMGALTLTRWPAAGCALSRHMVHLQNMTGDMASEVQYSNIANVVKLILSTCSAPQLKLDKKPRHVVDLA